jgi:heme A synthase
MLDSRFLQSLASLVLLVWAVVTVVATVALLVIGAIVTTFHVGMADPVWPTYPWHMLLISYDEPRPGFLIEHTHRLAGYIVGCCAIVLAILGTACALLEGAKRRNWLIGLCWAVLLCVIIQGILGGFRVRLNALFGPEFAAVHGIFAQVVFSMMVSVAVFTSRAFTRETTLDPAESRSLYRLSLTLTACVLLQLVWGSLARHTFHPVAQRLHFLTAFAVVAAVGWFVKSVWESPAAWERLRTPALLMAILIPLQLLLGVEAWMARFGSAQLPDMQRLTTEQAAICTAHVLLGSWLLAISVSCILLTRGAKVPHTAVVMQPFASRPRTDAIQSEPQATTSIHHREGTA